jgi:hypothetical protein
MDDEPIPPCAYCPSITQVSWSELFGWACPECRKQRTYRMLDAEPTAIPDRGEADASPFDTSFLGPHECELCNRPSPWHQMMCAAAEYGFTPHDVLGLPSLMRAVL